MQSSEEIKQVVKEKYGEIAKASKSSGCCGPTCCGGEENKIVGYTVPVSRRETSSFRQRQLLD